MRYLPFNYRQLNEYEGTHFPSTVKYCNNATFAFWERALFQRAQSVLDISGPDAWEGSVKDFLYYCLFRFGKVAISKDEERGHWFQPCALKGVSFYYQPTDAIITNPALDESLELKIGKDCELLKLTPDYQGIWDIITYYAVKLSLLDNAINMSLVNNKFAFMIGARNKAAGQAIKKMLDLINKGEPAVVWDQKLLNDPTDKAEPWQFLERKNLKSSYLTTDQLRDFQTLLNNFDCEIGIPTIPYEKKERMVTDEAQSRVLDSTSRSLVWFQTLTSSAKLCNRLYPGLNLKIEMRFDPEKGGASDEQRKDNASGLL